MAKLEEVVLRDITGNRPAAGIAGRLFFDTTLVKMQRDTGAAWEDVEGGGLANPMTNQGDIIVGGGGGAAGRLAVGLNTQVLTSDGTDPGWAAAGGGGYTEGARVYNSGNISVNDVTTTLLTYDSERYDTDAIHDIGVNPGRLTCKTAGKYSISTHVRFQADADGYRIVYIKLNGTTNIAIQEGNAPSGGSMIISCETKYDLAENDYVETLVYFLAGNVLNVEATGNYSPEFAMQRIG